MAQAFQEGAAMLVHAGTLAEHHRRCEAHFAAARKAADAGR